MNVLFSVELYRGEKHDSSSFLIMLYIKIILNNPNFYQKKKDGKTDFITVQIFDFSF